MESKLKEVSDVVNAVNSIDSAKEALQAIVSYLEQLDEHPAMSPLERAQHAMVDSTIERQKTFDESIKRTLEGQ